MKKITLLILVTEIILIVLCISLNVLKSPSCLKFERIKRCLHDKYIDPENEQKASDYFAHMETSFETKFMETVKLTNPRATIVRPKTGELSTFGIALLSMYQLDNKKTEYLTIVEDLIRKMDGKLGTLTRRNVVPWRDNWYGISVVFTRMLAMYEYIGTNRAIKDICHRRIVEITPKLNKSVGSVQTHVNFVYLAIPRLLTNYLYDRKQYDFEVKSELFSELHKELQVHFNPDYVVQNGIYQDYSCICHNNIPSFSYILTLGEFYLSTYKELGFKSSISNSIMKILHKVIHPKLDFIPYGLFGRDPKITCKETLRRYWPNYKRNPNYDVNIFPFIGLGVFKSEKFVFSVRVQRDGIAAYEFDNWYQQFALGWLQMRKLYHTEIDYSKYKSKMEWDKLKVQPGVISFAEENNNSFEAFKDKRSTYTLPEFCSEIKSYIGHLKNYKDKKLLYWFI
ncbi:putative envelope protein ODV-E66-17 [Microplitis demolitor]|nr:putative envelope protein ODV-E66-17 [Microplitis demolitor]